MKENDPVETAKALLSKSKEGAVWLAMMDAQDFVNYSAIARAYFGKSANWLLQRLHGYAVNGKPAAFKPEESAAFAAALRDIAGKLDAAAERIEKAGE